MFNLNLNIQKSFDEVCRDIENKRNNDYCGAYELIKHDKLKNECFKTKEVNTTTVKQGKLESIQTILDRTKVDQEEEKGQTVSAKDSNNKKSSKDSQLVFSQAHLQRLNKIQGKFKRNDLFVSHK